MLRAALTLFTILPARTEGKDVEDLSRHFHLIVLVGLLYGLMVWAIIYAGHERLPSMLTAALALAAVHLLNRFLHLDGLSDLGDGMVCGGDAERRMAAMKDSQTGAGGVGYVLVFSLLSFAALSSASTLALIGLPLMAEVTNKNAMVLCASGGKAREGLGNMFVSHTGGRQAMLSIALSLLLSAGAVLLLDLFLELMVWQEVVLVATVGVLVSSLVGLGMSLVAERNFGAVNGDVLGATNEICRPLTMTAMLLVMTI
jgi:adenosylcobinamide-GDP ribazoletransferase